MTDLRYPIGRFFPDPTPTTETRARHIDEIAGLAVAHPASRGWTKRKPT